MNSFHVVYLIRILSYIFILSLFSIAFFYVSSNYLVPRKTWVLLVAGSNSYMNYRHQADICHAYHILHNNGIPEENIIVMMYDDIAHSPLNPTPGIMVNSLNGPNVYEGVAKDYTKNHVTVRNFVNVLTGNEEAVRGVGSGRVIQSGPNDYILINFVDHGGPGFLGFPNELLHAADLREILQNMKSNNKFDKMIWFVEASYAGSIFDEILQDIKNVFVISASDIREPSNACYFDERRQTYLADVFSINWMKHIERDILSTFSMFSIFDIYQKVRTDTTVSHVEVYGDLTLGTCKASDFGGFPGNSEIPSYYADPNKNSVPNPLLPVALIEHKLQSTEYKDEKQHQHHKQEMQILYQNRSIVDKIMQKIVYKVVSDDDPEKVDRIQNYNLPIKKECLNCYKNVIQVFSTYCFDISKNLYLRNVAFMLVNMCNQQYTSTENISTSIKAVCSEFTFDSMPAEIY